MTLRIASYNIRFGGRGRVGAIAGILADRPPDVVILQEATDPMVVREIAGTLGLPTVVAAEGVSVAALSRIPISTIGWHELAPGRRAVELVFDESDLRIFGVHLSAGLSRRGETRRLVEVARLLARIEATGGGDRALVVGDLNAIAPGDGPLVRRLPLWIRVMLRVDGGIRTDAMRAFGEAGFTDAYRARHPAEPGFTMPSSFPSVRLDYVLAGASIAPNLREIDVLAQGVSRTIASDHLAIVADLDL